MRVFLSKIMPKNLTSSTTGIGLPFRRRWILYIRCSTDVVRPFGEDGAVFVKELLNRSLLLFSQLFRETAHNLLDYVDFGS